MTRHFNPVTSVLTSQTLPDLSHTHTHTHTHPLQNTHAYIPTHTHTQTHIPTLTYILISKDIHSHTWACTHARVHVRTHTHTHPLTGSEQGKYYELSVSSLEGIFDLLKSPNTHLRQFKVIGKLPGAATLDPSFHFDFFSWKFQTCPTANELSHTHHAATELINSWWFLFPLAPSTLTLQWKILKQILERALRYL